MSLAVHQNLALFTVTYNGVQFGGEDSDYASTPPTYRLRGQFVYDESGRTVKYTKYNLIVNAHFHGTTETDMAIIAHGLRVNLSKPGKTLKIMGLGTGFGTISNEVGYGPKPLFFDWTPTGQLTWEVVWQVEFCIVECPHSNNPNNWLVFNFDTSWVNDFEGLAQRTISGHVEIAPRRIGVRGKHIAASADYAIRNRLQIVVPPGFARVQNAWRENSAKNRIDFSITDQQESGTPLPIGCTMAAGSVNFSSSGRGGFAQGIVTMNMSVKTAPGQPPALGGQIILMAAVNKYNQMVKDNGALATGEATILPLSISITNGKFRQSRETTGTFTWLITKCVNTMLTSAGVWKPLVSNTDQDWRDSVSNLWTNRGTASLGSVNAEGVIIDLCDGVSAMTIGRNPTTLDQQGNLVPAFVFACPQIPENGGWVGHDLKISVKRIDNSTVHRKVTDYIPTLLAPQIGAAKGALMALGGSHFSETSSGQDVRHSVEYHGNPETFVLLQFRGLRMGRVPQVPEIKSIGGLDVIPSHEYDIDDARVVMDAPCPVYFVNGQRLYRVNGYINGIKPVESKTSCSAPNGDNTQY